jgi:hypothetical protein
MRERITKNRKMREETAKIGNKLSHVKGRPLVLVAIGILKQWQWERSSAAYPVGWLHT